MPRSSAIPYVLYPRIPLEPSAMATCYHCGLVRPAAALLWMKPSILGAYLALCGQCHAGHGVAYMGHEAVSPGVSSAASRDAAATRATG